MEPRGPAPTGLTRALSGRSEAGQSERSARARSAVLVRPSDPLLHRCVVPRCPTPAVPTVTPLQHPVDRPGSTPGAAESSRAHGPGRASWVVVIPNFSLTTETNTG